MAEAAVRVTVEDLATGFIEVVEVPFHDYWLIYTGDCDLTNVRVYANGTQVLTIKGRHQ